MGTVFYVLVACSYYQQGISGKDSLYLSSVCEILDKSEICTYIPSHSGIFKIINAVKGW